MSSTRFVFEGDPVSVFGKRFAGTALRHWLPDFVRDDVLRMRAVRVVDWRDTGQKLWQGVYVDGKGRGEWTWWHANGQKQWQGVFVDSKEHGEWTWWHANGQKRRQGAYVNGKKHGEWIHYNENGDVDRREHWEHYRDKICLFN